MLAGEYAVLKGGHSLAVTLTRGMTVTVEWDPTAASWEIQSDLWPSPKHVVDDHTPQSEMLCRAVQFAAKKTGMHGGKVSVTSEIDVEHGIGSSAALRLGVCAAFFYLQKQETSPKNDILPRDSIYSAWQLQTEGQGLASGYDVVTQYVGGLVEFNFQYSDNKWTPHWFKHQLESLGQFVQVFVGGSGAPTAQTLQTMTSWLDSGGRLERLIDLSENLVDAFIIASQWPNPVNLKNLVRACSASRALFWGNPHFPSNIASALSTVPGIDDRWSWKTTGAGGEDAILLVGRAADLESAKAKLASIGWHRLDAVFSESGAKILGPLAAISEIDEPQRSHPTKSTKLMAKTQEKPGKNSSKEQP